MPCRELSSFLHCFSQTDNTARYLEVVKRIDGRLGPAYTLDK